MGHTRRRYGFRWTPRGKAETVTWFDDRGMRDLHYRRIRQVGYSARKVSEKVKDDRVDRTEAVSPEAV